MNHCAQKNHFVLGMWVPSQVLRISKSLHCSPFLFVGVFDFHGFFNEAQKGNKWPFVCGCFVVFSQKKQSLVAKGSSREACVCCWLLGGLSREAKNVCWHHRYTNAYSIWKVVQFGRASNLRSLNCLCFTHRHPLGTTRLKKPTKFPPILSTPSLEVFSHSQTDILPTLIFFCRRFESTGSMDTQTETLTPQITSSSSNSFCLSAFLRFRLAQWRLPCWFICLLGIASVPCRCN